jgi:hypothetical protein
MPFSFLRGKKDHNPDDVAVLMDVTGHCGHCRQHVVARMTAYWSGEILYRCTKCKKTGNFTIDEEAWTSAKAFLPFKTDKTDNI